MRSASTLVLLATLAACQSESELRFVSTLDSETSGVRFSEDGTQSHVGMAGMTCTVSTEWGCPTDDADLPTEREVVLDHYEGQTLAATADAVHIIDAEGWVRDADLPVSAVHAARYTDRGVLMLRGGSDSCEIQVGDTHTDVPDSFCVEGLQPDVDRTRGAFYIAAVDGVYALDETGAHLLAEDADLVAWDPTLQQAYLADKGGTVVTAVKRDGTLVWTTDVGLPISDLETRGTTGQVLVLVEDEDGLGSLIRLSGEDGKRMGESTVPTDEGDVVVSDNGLTVGIILPEQVHFFELVRPDEGEQAAPEEAPKDCLRGDRLGID